MKTASYGADLAEIIEEGKEKGLGDVDGEPAVGKVE